MKKIITGSLLMLAVAATMPKTSYAAFPVQQTTATTQTAGSDAMSTIATQQAMSQEVKMPTAPKPAPAGGSKSHVAAILLAFFLGGLGIHRFYLGYTWQGVVQLLTLGGLGVWALIDLIRIIIKSLQPKDGSYE